MRNKLLQIGAGLSLTMAATFSLNAHADESPWYLGFNFGQSSLTQDTQEVSISDFGGNYALTFDGEVASSNEEADFWQFYSGYRFTRRWSIEAGYVNFDKIEAVGLAGGELQLLFGTKADGDPIIGSGEFQNASLATKYHTRGFAVYGVAHHAFNRHFSVKGRLGILAADSNVKLRMVLPDFTVIADGETEEEQIQEDIESTPIDYSFSDSTMELASSISLYYDFSRSLSIGMRYDYFFDVGGDNIGEQDIEMFSAELQYLF